MMVMMMPMMRALGLSLLAAFGAMCGYWIDIGLFGFTDPPSVLDVPFGCFLGYWIGWMNHHNDRKPDGLHL